MEEQEARDLADDKKAVDREMGGEIVCSQVIGLSYFAIS